MGDSCISLSGSTTCPAFANASISTDSNLVGLYSFLQYVSNRQDFDTRLSEYVTSDYAKLKYQQLLGCSNINLSNTTSLYARYTTSVICNGIVQNSKDTCNLSSTQAEPLCADTCALFATSEEEIAADSSLCGSPQSSFMSQIRADFTDCSLPADSLSGSCISGEDNEPAECGYGTNLLGLCGYCASSSPNATDSCCTNANASSRCDGVTLPSSTSTLPPLVTSTSSSSATASASSGLSGGQIAGIAVGAVAGFLLLAALAALLFICLRRKRRNQETAYSAPAMRQSTAASAAQYNPAHPGGRVTRMSALQTANSTSSPSAPASTVGATAAAATGAAKYETSDSEQYGSSPDDNSKRRARTPGKRNGSLSSTSMLGGDFDSSPNSRNGGQMSSPEGIASGQSEQLPYFRDYYSQDEIHPNDKVAVLWAYHPRAGDEFELDRGDMLKVVGIWDDGWATGVRLNDRAEDYDNRHREQRDSGVSGGSTRRGVSPPPSGEIKAFPLVCVCLPEHWRKTIEGDAPEDL